MIAYFSRLASLKGCFPVVLFMVAQVDKLRGCCCWNRSRLQDSAKSGEVIFIERKQHDGIYMPALGHDRGTHPGKDQMQTVSHGICAKPCNAITDMISHACAFTKAPGYNHKIVIIEKIPAHVP